MRAKKLVVAVAIFGGVLFMAQAVNAYNLDGTTTVKVDKRKVKK
ncbi:hypothetical protein [Pseudalgibacter alginicilyticus]|nr:hypothetical protein [Pseudalgibacter alginicilyticus]